MRWMLACFLASTAAHAQVVLRPVFEVERVDRYRLDAVIALEQEGEEAVPARELRQRVEFRLTTAHVDPSGRAVVSCAIEHIDVSLTDGDESASFVWPGEAEPSDLADAWSLIADNVLRLHVDETGRIRAVEGAEALSEQISATRQEATTELGLFSPGIIDRTLAPVWGVDPIGDERRAGDAWGVRERRTISGHRRINLNRTYEATSVSDDLVELVSVLEIESLPVETPTIVDVRISGGGEGAAAWNVQRGVVESWREDSTMVIEASIQDAAPITTRLRRSASLTRLGGDS